METVIKEKKIYIENNLLKFGTILFFGSLLGSIILSYFNESEFSSRITRFNDFTLIHFIAAFTIAPVLEELIFRGIFTGKKIFKYVMYLGSLLYIILLQNYYLIPILAIFIVAFELNRSKNFPYHIYYSSAVLFGLMHYEFNDLKLLDTWIGIVMTSGMGLILIWMVLNFGLIYSILLHALNNFVAIAIVVLGNETADMTLKKVETQDFTMKYQRVSFFIKDGNMEVENNKFLKAENMSISTIHNALCFDESLDDLYFGKFNVLIERKSNSTKKLNCESFHQLLNKTDLKEN
ncbi:CPBP family intramembrane glutamic endopeptidase [Chryseobacterium indoltheticum]|uniref:CPBP family intramembrane glutamic endopeptidase n=1 Tax=Chryseobacterium indoltheticum TaxID=254 RepID=UPI00242F8395|nr:CPBP family intramembrane metalloprotease [Chryseobacterium indoltheticum]